MRAVARSLALAAGAAAMSASGRPGHGLIGYGTTMYDPTCAYACRSVLESSMLGCSDAMDMSAMGGMHMDSSTSPACYATDDAFLQTLALCISAHCPGEPVWKLEQYWNMNVAGRQVVQPDPKMSYQAALASVNASQALETLTAGGDLRQAMRVADDDWLSNYNAMVNFEDAEDLHERYALVVFLSGVAVPVGLSLLRFLPVPASLYARFVYPAAVGTRHKAPLGVLHVPTRGQALFVAYLVLLNAVLTFVGVRAVSPNAWFAPGQEVVTYIANRAGVLSFANLPLLIVYSGRNNLLLRLTNWSHDTFLLAHKCVAWIATLQACLHSAIYLQLKVAAGEHASESALPYWYWGIVATLCMAILLPCSVAPLRLRFYEAFLTWHIALSALAVAGCMLHILDRFGNQWGYEVWLFIAIAIWAFERVARLARVARNGLRTAHISVIDEDYISVSIPSVRAHGHAYLYFPTLSWRAWRNHPFSVAGCGLPVPAPAPPAQVEAAAAPDAKEALHHLTPVASPLAEQQTTGITFLIRTRAGLTPLLRQHTRLRVLVEASYGAAPDLSCFSRIVVVAGGVGISGVLSVLCNPAYASRMRLHWAVRSQALVSHVEESIRDVEHQVYLHRRMDVRQVLERDGGHGAAVLVCGPPSLADAVRAEVARGGGCLFEESYSW